MCPTPTGPPPPPNHPPNPHGNTNLCFVILKDDTATTRPVAVINEAFARRFFKNENPLGKHFGPDKIQYASKYEIVGVVKDMRYMTYDYKDPIGPMYWISETQTTHWDDPVFEAGEIWSHYLYNIVIWAPGTPPGIEEKVRKALASVDLDLVLYGVNSYDKVVRGDFGQEDMIATLTTGFGALGPMLSAVGLYGVMAYMVKQRTGEIGVRMVLRGAFSQVGHRIGDRHSRRDRRRQADDAAISIYLIDCCVPILPRGLCSWVASWTARPKY